MENNPVLNTLIYESIFNFPLKRFEIWKFLISNKKISKKTFAQLLKDKNIFYDQGSSLYCLANRKNSISRRIEAEKISVNKLNLARRIALDLARIPTIELIGISGSLALGSSSEEDDIDLFVICKRDTIWTTRLIAVILLKLKRAYRTEKNFKDKVCLNMIIDNYSFPKNRWNLYSAFEIAKLSPVFSKDNAYSRFLKSNAWAGKFLPNMLYEIDKFEEKRLTNPGFINRTFKFLEMIKFEKLAKTCQLIYMKRKTNEEVSDHLLAFHPRDFRKEIMTQFNTLIGSTRGH